MKYVVAILLLLSLFSCEKSTTDCTYQITCIEQLIKDGERLPLTSALGFVFYADTATYTPKSYAEAVSGVVSDKFGTSSIKADVVATFDVATGIMVMPNLSKAGKAVFVICNVKDKIYSFRQYTVEENLPLITTSLDFCLYKFVEMPVDGVKESGWIQKK